MFRPTEHQLERLVQFLEENPGVAKGHLRSSQARHQTKQKWEEVTLLLNAMGGATKDAKAWAKFWADKKYALKKLVSQRRRSASQTGGGTDRLPPLTELDERLLSLMGGSSFAEGDRELRVPLGVSMEPAEPSHIVIEVIDEAPDPSQAAQSPPAAEPELPSTPRRSPRRRRRLQRSQFDLERDRLMHIEQARVNAELKQAEALRGIVQALNNIASAITAFLDRDH